MIRIEVMGHRATKIIRRAELAKHKKWHLDNAKQIRENAEHSLKQTIKWIAENVPEHLTDEAMDECMKNYNNLLSEAIAQENVKCMEAH